VDIAVPDMIVRGEREGRDTETGEPGTYVRFRGNRRCAQSVRGRLCCDHYRDQPCLAVLGNLVASAQIISFLRTGLAIAAPILSVFEPPSAARSLHFFRMNSYLFGLYFSCCARGPFSPNCSLAWYIPYHDAFPKIRLEGIRQRVYATVCLNYSGLTRCWNYR